MSVAQIIHGDCLEYMRAFRAEGVQVQCIVTDPPYELNFMGRNWDNCGVAFNVETWRLAYDLLPPGGHLLAFSGTRTYHRMVCAIEDAGFEIRDQVCWLYGTGFPKSLNVSKQLDKMAGVEREVSGVYQYPDGSGPRAVIDSSKSALVYGKNRPGGSVPITAPATDAAKQWAGWGTALKPSHEPICLARKPLMGTVAQNVLTHGVGALNIDATRIPGIKPDRDNIAFGAWRDMEGRIDRQSPKQTYNAHHGRWPANLVHDSSPEVLDAFAAFGESKSPANYKCNVPMGYGDDNIYGKGELRDEQFGFGDTGTASRFFYSAKASKADRANSKHPTVKPQELLKWLARMVCPPGGTILDPFAGSGSMAQAALSEGFNVILIEKEAEYIADIIQRFHFMETMKSEKQEQIPPLLAAMVVE
jgi:DNA modification methylase